ncbi:MAG: spermidine/putrescine ABC transporter substrate-binding protein, partial [Spirochaetaceae bacterium]|nr:spermidine/putrescine ABC transporter substrate-binding protein [Spirochaetaceae bacterium]
MKKNSFALIALVFALVFPAVVSAGGSKAKSTAKKQLTLFTWEAMFPQEILDGFEAETGITVNYV